MASSRKAAAIKPERWRRVDELFAAALELHGAARQRFLESEVDADLLPDVESLLKSARESEDFLETPVWTAAATAAALNTGGNAAGNTTGNPAAKQFVAGDVIANRYRIVGLLGRGGMGDVYRADDLKLNQPVALKFLSASLSRSGAAQARFHREVSLARQISHRHVCRVYDIGEHAGLHFLTMEYVKGEELSSLLRRIGRLPFDKAIEIARQLCAGLAAIHGAGVLHRDLKPANVMIDEHGDVRITDFGVAALSEGVSGSEAMIGTPAYMSPEQLAGGELTPRSDIYALGLVLHETFTGKRPSMSATDLDPVVERVILRCLEKDPARRPATALQVAAALPGGDPLKAALAAGETPSPQMVAAAGLEGSLRPRYAVLLLLAIFAGFGLVTLFASRVALHNILPLTLSPELLRVRAADIAQEAGYTAPPADVATGFRENWVVLRYVAEHDSHADRWQRFRASPLPAVRYWYRSSPRPLVASDHWYVDADDPPNTLAGMVRMQFDTAGRLLSFEAAPPQEEAAARGLPGEPRWTLFFERAGLSIGDFQPASPRWTPPQHSDVRRSWTGVHPQRPDLPLRVEAASYRGKPVWFEIVWPWQKAEREPANVPGAEAFTIVLLTFYFSVMALAALLAWKNVRQGRGDRRGAFRLVLFVFTLRMVYWLFMAHHVLTIDELGGLMAALRTSVYWAVLIGVLYLALEPFVRRRWPELLISWSRLLAGDVRDPLVGRDVLVGALFGLALVLANALYFLVPRAPNITSDLVYLHGLNGVRGFVPLLLNQTIASILFPLIITTVVLFFAMITRRNRVGLAIGWVAFYFALNLNFGDGTLLGYLVGVIAPTLLLVALTRFGFLALSAMFFFTHLWAFYPVTTRITAWYATTFLLELAVLTAIALYAFRVSLAGQKVVNDALFE